MTLAIALIGLVLAAASFGWQIFTHLASGPKIKLLVSNGVLPYQEPPLDWLVVVTAINTGRAAASIASWGLRTPDGQNLHQVEPVPWAPTLPHRLEPQASVELYMPVANLRQICTAQGIAISSLRSWVRLGTDKLVFGGPPKVAED